MPYILEEIRYNLELENSHPSFFTFDVLTNLDGDKRWLSVPYELYFEWVMKENESLGKYINQPKFKNLRQVIKDLIDLEFDFNESITKYIHAFYTYKIFKSLPTYNPDKFFEQDDDDDIAGMF
jgi:hypothetical protein